MSTSKAFQFLSSQFLYKIYESFHAIKHASGFFVRVRMHAKKQGEGDRIAENPKHQQKNRGGDRPVMHAILLFSYCQLLVGSRQAI